MKAISGKILVFLFLLSIMGAIINNLTTDYSVPWLGSPEVYEKPEDN